MYISRYVLPSNSINTNGAFLSHLLIFQIQKFGIHKFYQKKNSINQVRIAGQLKMKFTTNTRVRQRMEERQCYLKVSNTHVDVNGTLVAKGK